MWYLPDVASSSSSSTRKQQQQLQQQRDDAAAAAAAVTTMTPLPHSPVEEAASLHYAVPRLLQEQQHDGHHTDANAAAATRTDGSSSSTHADDAVHASAARNVHDDKSIAHYFVLPPPLVVCLVRHLDVDLHEAATPQCIEQCVRELQAELTSTPLSCRQVLADGEGSSSSSNNTTRRATTTDAAAAAASRHCLPGSSMRLQLGKAVDVHASDGAALVNVCLYSVDEPHSRPRTLAHIVKTWRAQLAKTQSDDSCLVLLHSKQLLAARSNTTTTRTSSSSSSSGSDTSVHVAAAAAMAMLEPYYAELRVLQLAPHDMYAYVTSRDAARRIVGKLRRAFVLREQRLLQLLDRYAARKRALPLDPRQRASAPLQVCCGSSSSSSSSRVQQPCGRGSVTSVAAHTPHSRCSSVAATTTAATPLTQQQQQQQHLSDGARVLTNDSIATVATTTAVTTDDDNNNDGHDDDSTHDDVDAVRGSTSSSSARTNNKTTATTTAAAAAAHVTPVLSSTEQQPPTVPPQRQTATATATTKAAVYWSVQRYWRHGYDLFVHYMQFGCVHDAHTLLQQRMFAEYYNNSDDYALVRCADTLVRLSPPSYAATATVQHESHAVYSDSGDLLRNDVCRCALFDTRATRQGKHGYPHALDTSAELLDGLLLLVASDVACCVLLGEAARDAHACCRAMLQILCEKLDDTASSNSSTAATTTAQQQQQQQQLPALLRYNFLLHYCLSCLCVLWPQCELTRQRRDNDEDDNEDERHKDDSSDDDSSCGDGEGDVYHRADCALAQLTRHAHHIGVLPQTLHALRVTAAYHHHQHHDHPHHNSSSSRLQHVQRRCGVLLELLLYARTYASNVAATAMTHAVHGGGDDVHDGHRNNVNNDNTTTESATQLWRELTRMAALVYTLTQRPRHAFRLHVSLAQHHLCGVLPSGAWTTTTTTPAVALQPRRAMMRVARRLLPLLQHVQPEWGVLQRYVRCLYVEAVLRTLQHEQQQHEQQQAAQQAAVVTPRAAMTRAELQALLSRMTPAVWSSVFASPDAYVWLRKHMLYLCSSSAQDNGDDDSNKTTTAAAVYTYKRSAAEVWWLVRALDAAALSMWSHTRDNDDEDNNKDSDDAMLCTAPLDAVVSHMHLYACSVPTDESSNNNNKAMHMCRESTPHVRVGTTLLVHFYAQCAVDLLDDTAAVAASNNNNNNDTANVSVQLTLASRSDWHDTAEATHVVHVADVVASSYDAAAQRLHVCLRLDACHAGSYRLRTLTLRNASTVFVYTPPAPPARASSFSSLLALQQQHHHAVLPLLASAMRPRALRSVSSSSSEDNSSSSSSSEDDNAADAVTATQPSQPHAARNAAADTKNSSKVNKQSTATMTCRCYLCACRHNSSSSSSRPRHAALFVAHEPPSGAQLRVHAAAHEHCFADAVTHFVVEVVLRQPLRAASGTTTTTTTMTTRQQQARDDTTARRNTYCRFEAMNNTLTATATTTGAAAADAAVVNNSSSSALLATSSSSASAATAAAALWTTTSSSFALDGSFTMRQQQQQQTTTTTAQSDTSVVALLHIVPHRHSAYVLRCHTAAATAATPAPSPHLSAAAAAHTTTAQQHLSATRRRRSSVGVIVDVLDNNNNKEGVAVVGAARPAVTASSLSLRSLSPTSLPPPAAAASLPPRRARHEQTQQAQTSPSSLSLHAMHSPQQQQHHHPGRQAHTHAAALPPSPARTADDGSHVSTRSVCDVPLDQSLVLGATANSLSNYNNNNSNNSAAAAMLDATTPCVVIVHSTSAAASHEALLQLRSRTAAAAGAMTTATTVAAHVRHAAHTIVPMNDADVTRILTTLPSPRCYNNDNNNSRSGGNNDKTRATTAANSTQASVTQHDVSYVLEAAVLPTHAGPAAAAAAMQQHGGVLSMRNCHFLLRATQPISDAADTARNNDDNSDNNNDAVTRLELTLPLLPTFLTAAQATNEHTRLTFTCLQQQQQQHMQQTDKSSSSSNGGGAASATTTTPFVFAAAFDVRYRFRQLHDSVYCVATVRNALSTTSLWLRGAMLCLHDTTATPQPYRVVRVCSAYASLLQREWHAGATATLLFELAPSRSTTATTSSSHEGNKASDTQQQQQQQHYVQLQLFYSDWQRTYASTAVEDRLVLLPQHDEQQQHDTSSSSARSNSSRSRESSDDDDTTTTETTTMRTLQYSPLALAALRARCNCYCAQTTSFRSAHTALFTAVFFVDANTSSSSSLSHTGGRQASSDDKSNSMHDDHGRSGSGSGSGNDSVAFVAGEPVRLGVRLEPHSRNWPDTTTRTTTSTSGSDGDVYGDVYVELTYNALQWAVVGRRRERRTLSCTHATTLYYTVLPLPVSASAASAVVSADTSSSGSGAGVRHDGNDVLLEPPSLQLYWARSNNNNGSNSNSSSNSNSDTMVGDAIRVHVVPLSRKVRVRRRAV